MSHSNAANQLQVQLLTPVTKRLVTDNNQGFITKIQSSFGVQIQLNNTGNSQYIIIRGSKASREAAADFVALFDHEASLFAKAKNLNTKKDVKRRHAEDMAPAFHRMLTDAVQKYKQLRDGKPVNEMTEIPSATAAPAAPAQHVQREVEGIAALANLPKPNIGTKFKLSAFVPRNVSQALTFTAARNPDMDVMFLGGPAGGGKTYAAIAAAIRLVTDGHATHIDIIRPDTGAGKSPGAVPGGLQQKEDMFLRTVSETLIEQTGKPLSEHMKGGGLVKSAGTPFTRRGATMKSVTIVDEGQNFAVDQAKMIITRIGEGGKFIITGDISNHQNDLRGRVPGMAFLVAALGHKFNQGNPDLRRGLGFVEYTKLEASARHRLLPAMHEAFDDLPEHLSQAMMDMEQVPPRVMQATKLFMEAARTQMTQGAVTTYNRFINPTREQFPAIFEGSNDSRVVHLGRPAIN